MTMKLFTVLVRHISTKNQQIYFPSFYCPIVCSYCSIVCLIIKIRAKMVKISTTSYENEVHRIDSTSNEDSENIISFAREALISEEEWPKNLEKMAKTEKSIVMQIREWSIIVANTGLHSLVSKFLHNFGFSACQIKLYEQVSFQAKFCSNVEALPSLKLGEFFKF